MKYRIVLEKEIDGFYDWHIVVKRDSLSHWEPFKVNGWLLNRTNNGRLFSKNRNKVIEEAKRQLAKHINKEKDTQEFETFKRQHKEVIDI